MDRDRRLTGFLRGQTDNPTAPLGFELNSPWRVCALEQASQSRVTFANDFGTAREAFHLNCDHPTLPLVHILVLRRRTRTNKQLKGKIGIS